MIKVTDIQSDKNSNAVIIYTEGNYGMKEQEQKLYKILLSDYADLPFSCKKGTIIEAEEVGGSEWDGRNPTPTNSHYDGNKAEFLSFLSKKFKIYNSAVSKIAAADITRKGLIRKLTEIYRKQNIDKETLQSLCELVVDKFVDMGYINDYRYAFERAKYQKEKNHYGIYRIKNYLYTKGVERDVINEVLDSEEFENFDEDILYHLKKKYDVNSLNDRKIYMKATGALSRLGFSFDEIKRVMSDYSDGCFDDEL